MRRRNCKCADADGRRYRCRKDSRWSASEANAVWSMDFVFDRVAGGRAIKNLAIVDDATHEAIAVVPERNISGRQLVRMLEEICRRRGYPKSFAPTMARNFVVER